MKLILFSFVILTMSCKEKIQEAIFVNYNSKLDSLTAINSNKEMAAVDIDLCMFFNKTSWDSIAFILPYLPEEYLNNLSYENKDAAMDTMRFVIGVEWNCGILFIKNNEVTSYSVVKGNPNFVDVVGEHRTEIPILPHSKCQVKLLTIHRDDSLKSLFFVPANFSLEDALQKRRTGDGNDISIDSLLSQ